VTVYRFIAARKTEHSVKTLCRVLGVSRSGYHAWQRRPPSRRARADAALGERIGQIHRRSLKTYGSPRVHAELRLDHDIRVGRKRVERLMRRAGLSGQVRRRRGKTTIRVQGVRTAPDLVQRDFNPTGPNRLWAADITYIRTWEGWLYLASVMDCYSRRIVGWAIADHLRAELVVDALEMAVTRRRPNDRLVHHSDQGSQGGFQRSSQRSIRRSCDGQAEASVGSSRAAGDAITGSATGRSTRTPAALLGGDCARRAQRRGRCRGGRVAGGGRPVVSGGWRDAADQSGSAVGAVPVVRRARGDRGAAGRWLWGARGCAPAGSLAVDDLAGVAAQRRDAQRPLGLPGDDGAVACRSAR
jgi:putative transposase